MRHLLRWHWRGRQGADEVMRPRWAWRFEVTRRDAWIGAYWKHGSSEGAPVGHRWLHIYVCLVPCVPLHVQVLRPLPPGYFDFA